MKKMLLSIVLVLVAALGLSALYAAAPAGQSAEKSGGVKPLQVLLITGGCCHDYEAQKKILSEGISARANVEFTIIHEGGKSLDHKVSIYSKPNWSKGYDVVIHDECFAEVKDRAFVEGILDEHRKGTPAVNLHCAMHCYRVDFDNYKEWFAFTGVDTRRHGKQQPITIKYTDKSHPITKGLPDWVTIKEELYDILEVWPTVTPLATGDTEQQPENLLIWTNAYGPKKTRVFSTTLGHNNETVGDDRYLDLLTRGVLWAAGKLDDSGKPMPGYGK